MSFVKEPAGEDGPQAALGKGHCWASQQWHPLRVAVDLLG